MRRAKTVAFTTLSVLGADATIKVHAGSATDVVVDVLGFHP